jgi:hypothetical protein
MDRILRKVERRRASALVADECWLWTGATNGGVRGGYGHMKVGGKNVVPRLVHRIVFELAHRPLAAGETVDHVCGVRRCCNPDHLQAVSHGENVRLGVERRRLLAAA